MQDPTRPEMRLPDASVPELRAQVEAVLQDRDLLQKGHARAVREVVYRLDRGDLRVAERIDGPERWIVHGWIQQSISLYFGLAPLETYQAGDLEFHDKVPPKHGLAGSGVRVVPPGVVRYGAHVEKGAVVMPGYVNIGARVGAGTLVDTWATVASCAQVGRNVHLAGGVGIGGVLEPPEAEPVIIEDDCFISSRCIIVNGARVRRGSALGAGTILSGSIPVIDAATGEEVSRGDVPENCLVVQASRRREFPGGEFGLPCALIIARLAGRHDKLTLE